MQLNLQPTSKVCSQAVSECISRYGDSRNLMAVFNPGNQARFAMRKDRCYIGSAPTLYTVAAAYGRNTAVAWLEIQIRDLSVFSGCRDKMSNPQVLETAMHVYASFCYMKLTELMLFFHMVKGGRYGHFYGAVDGMRITEALTDFSRLRNVEIARYEQIEKDRKRAEEERGRKDRVIPREDWEELKESWQMWAGFMTPDTWNSEDEPPRCRALPSGG